MLLRHTHKVLYQYPVAHGGLSAGLMHSLTRVNHASLNQIQRLGGVVIREFEGPILGVARPSFTGTVALSGRPVEARRVGGRDGHRLLVESQVICSPANGQHNKTVS